MTPFEGPKGIDVSYGDIPKKLDIYHRTLKSLDWDKTIDALRDLERAVKAYYASGEKIIRELRSYNTDKARLKITARWGKALYELTRETDQANNILTKMAKDRDAVRVRIKKAERNLKTCTTFIDKHENDVRACTACIHDYLADHIDDLKRSLSPLPQFHDSWEIPIKMLDSLDDLKSKGFTQAQAKQALKVIHIVLSKIEP